MSAFKGTPGPWDAVCTPFGLSIEANHPTVPGGRVHVGTADGQNRFNADLLAAAPDLLDALQSLLWTRTQERGLQNAQPGDSPLHDRCKAAIIKAGGRVL